MIADISIVSERKSEFSVSDGKTDNSKLKSSIEKEEVS